MQVVFIPYDYFTTMDKSYTVWNNNFSQSKCFMTCRYFTCTASFDVLTVYLFDGDPVWKPLHTNCFTSQLLTAVWWEETVVSSKIRFVHSRKVNTVSVTPWCLHCKHSCICHFMGDRYLTFSSLKNSPTYHKLSWGCDNALSSNIWLCHFLFK